MKTFVKNPIIILLALFLLVPEILLAHNPRIVKAKITEIQNPENSQAFYGELRGSEAEFVINSDKEFSLYAGILVPDIKNIRTDISAEIYTLKDGKKETLALLEGSKHQWKPFHEEYGQDNYLWGPEYKAEDSKGDELKGRSVPAGSYRIRVFSPANLGKYVFVVGTLEVWPAKEIINAMLKVPILKLTFFEEPVLKVLLSKFGMIYGFFLLLLAGLAGMAYKKAVGSR